MVKGSTLAIIIVGSSVGGLLIGGLIVFFVLRMGDQATAPVLPVNTANTTNTTEQPDDTDESGAEQPAGPTANWRAYSDEFYNVDFLYPPEWAPIEVFDQNESFFFEGFFSTDVEFNAVEADFRSLSIATLTDLEQLDIEEVNDSVATLQSVYSSGTDAFVESAPLAIPIGGGIFYNTDPVYVESGDGSYRGLYYFAQMGNGLPQEGRYIDLPALVMVLTNGEEVVQFIVDMGADVTAEGISFFGTYDDPADSCNSGQFIDAVGDELCYPAIELELELEDYYLPLADTLEG